MSSSSSTSARLGHRAAVSWRRMQVRPIQLPTDGRRWSFSPPSNNQRSNGSAATPDGTPRSSTVASSAAATLGGTPESSQRRDLLRSAMRPHLLRSNHSGSGNQETQADVDAHSASRFVSSRMGPSSQHFRPRTARSSLPDAWLQEVTPWASLHPLAHVHTPVSSSLTWRSIHTSAPVRSGHNRWSKIRHRKGAADSQRSLKFSKISTEIMMALRPPASPDPSVNPRLAAILEKARAIGYPKANVEAAMNKALNPQESSKMQHITYEAIGSGGQVALIIEALTDNPNRSISGIREKLNKHGGRLSSSLFHFERRGLIKIRVKNDTSADDIAAAGIENLDPAIFDSVFEMAVEAGAEDVRENVDEDGPLFEVITQPSDLAEVARSLTSELEAKSTTLAALLTVESIDLAYLASNPLSLPSEEGASVQDNAESADSPEVLSEEVAEKVANLVAALEDVDDVSKVWTNVNGL